MFPCPSIQDNQINQDDQGGQAGQENQDKRDNQNDQGGQGNQGNYPDSPDNKPDHANKSLTCPTKVCEDITLSVPVEVRAHADIKGITLKCDKHHIRQLNQYDKATKTHKFEITKKISAQIPIDFIAEVEIKDERVSFDVHECT